MIVPGQCPQTLSPQTARRIAFSEDIQQWPLHIPLSTGVMEVTAGEFLVALFVFILPEYKMNDNL